MSLHCCMPTCAFCWNEVCRRHCLGENGVQGTETQRTWKALACARFTPLPMRCQRRSSRRGQQVAQIWRFQASAHTAKTCRSAMKQRQRQQRNERHQHVGLRELKAHIRPLSEWRKTLSVLLVTHSNMSLSPVHSRRDEARGHVSLSLAWPFVASLRQHF